MSEVDQLRARIEARATASGPVHAALFRMILRQKLRGPIVEARVAEELAASRLSVRLALLRLESEYLVVRGDNGGFLVRWIDYEEFRSSLEVREILESEAAALATGRIPDEKLAVVRASMETFWTPAASHEALWRLDDELHDLIGDYCDNPVLAATIKPLRNAVRLYDAQFVESRRRPGRQEENLIEHFAILDALQHGPSERTRKAMRAHIRGVAG